MHIMSLHASANYDYRIVVMFRAYIMHSLFYKMNFHLLIRAL